MDRKKRIRMSIRDIPKTAKQVWVEKARGIMREKDMGGLWAGVREISHKYHSIPHYEDEEEHKVEISVHKKKHDEEKCIEKFGQWSATKLPLVNLDEDESEEDEQDDTKVEVFKPASAPVPPTKADSKEGNKDEINSNIDPKIGQMLIRAEKVLTTLIDTMDRCRFRLDRYKKTQRSTRAKKLACPLQATYFRTINYIPYWFDLLFRKGCIEVKLTPTFPADLPGAHDEYQDLAQAYGTLSIELLTSESEMKCALMVKENFMATPKPKQQTEDKKQHNSQVMKVFASKFLPKARYNRYAKDIFVSDEWRKNHQFVIEIDGPITERRIGFAGDYCKTLKVETDQIGVDFLSGFESRTAKLVFLEVKDIGMTPMINGSYRRQMIKGGKYLTWKMEIRSKSEAAK